ncbi:hypothetical protein BKA83DRAFT_4028288, partial [Pisolithus microcarpus]
SPFSVTHTYIPWLGVEPAVSRTEAAMTCASNIQLVIESTRKALQHTAEKMIQRGEASWLEAPEYSVGQEVWLDTTHVHVDGHPSQKLMEKWIGP